MEQVVEEARTGSERFITFFSRREDITGGTPNNRKHRQ